MQEIRKRKLFCVISSDFLSFIVLEAKRYDHIIIKDARVNNLKHLSVSIPKNKLIVLTGLSGSGKSSLAFDTLYAEGQRRYVESLSAYARQFLGKMHKPEVESIVGLSPAIAIEQKVNTRNPRSTVGTSTEVYEYLKLLYARVGHTYSPISGTQVKRHQVMDVVQHIMALPEGSAAYILSPLLIPDGRSLKDHLAILLQQGFIRLLVGDKVTRIEDYITGDKLDNEPIFIIIDRIKVNANIKELVGRLSDSVQTAFYEGKESCVVRHEYDGKTFISTFSSRFEADGIVFDPPCTNMFAFNSPSGACQECQGFGHVIGIDPNLVIPNPSLSVFDGAIACWKGDKMSGWKDQLIRVARHFNFPVHKPYKDLSEEQKQVLWEGNRYFMGINDFFKNEVEPQTYKLQYRVMLSRFRGRTICPICHGTRLKKEAQYVRVGDKNITELVTMPLDELQQFFQHLVLDDREQQIASRLLIEINNRLNFLVEVGLGYLTLNRLSNTLSGGESQRINLATSLGSSLVGSTYILDEPSIGLHPRDTDRLIKVLQHLRDIGNTVIVVEHDEQIIRCADQIIDIGPYAGSGGGELVFQGDFVDMNRNPKGLTAEYLLGLRQIPKPSRRRHWNNAITIHGACENNLKNIDVQFPLNVLTVVTGVSGSGKSTLVKSILYPALKRHFGEGSDHKGSFSSLSGSLGAIQSVEFIDQDPIGKSSRSNPAIYLKAFDEIRQLFADQKISKARGLKAGYFSFNVPGGRCEHCEGEGTIKIEMQFMADVYLPCDVCHGNRYKDEVLEIRFEGKNISEILDMTVDDAIIFFSYANSANNTTAKIIAKLKPLQDVGLGYLKLGQSSSTLSGGEAQRVKLASFLAKGKSEKPTLFIFDEPTTGLHFHDISKLLDAFNALLENGHSLLVIEHNAEIIKSADWIIDLGPEGGDKGGNIVFQGRPEDLAYCQDSYTGMTLKEKLT